MKNVTPVILSRLALYFGLIKTTMTNQLLDTNFFVQLLEDILAFKTFVLDKFLFNRVIFFFYSRRDATIMVGISKALETYSQALT